VIKWKKRRRGSSYFGPWVCNESRQ